MITILAVMMLVIIAIVAKKLLDGDGFIQGNIGQI